MGVLNAADRVVTIFTIKMTSRLLSVTQKAYGFSNIPSSRSLIRMLGAPPEKARSLKKKIEAYNRVDEEVVRRVDIGLPSPHAKDRTLALERSKLISKIKNDPEMERLAREQKLDVPLETIEKGWMESGTASQQIKTIADHYGIFEHLFGYAYFFPRVMLDIGFEQKDESIVPVFRGNIVKPKEAVNAPVVNFESDKGSLWTLLLTNPDGHLTEENAEYVHWFIGNIPGNDVSKGDVIYQYLRPFPPAGTGYQRLVFILYKQAGKIDYSSLKKEGPCTDLTLRTFSTLEFYRPRQDQLTPAGLAFCQTDYDYSVQKTFHEILNMQEPIFEYDFPEHYVAKPKWFPDHDQSFDVYLDRYRDPRELNKEYMLTRLKTTDPFQKEKKKLQYPLVHLHLDRSIPSWLRRRKGWELMGWGQVNESK
ncbi:39S ribosomal protein L38, mitochondrial [Frankliniella fusca]|uniref:Large ribosomal subunit protein mL38 n=1 Tax=Frankliniella fusca TaxID=407009 RepID=A0AAE1HE03_9NEOP|nr:39S ribosomal protein L38, mitochondrial [Frankliniella fusca]